MNIQAEKLEIMKMILDTDNPSILRKIKSLFIKDKDFWDTLSGAEKEDIRQGIDELERGEIYPYDEMMKKHRQ
jgi:hypothetical protein